MTFGKKMLAAEPYLALRAELVEALAFDWAPHVSLVATINRALKADDVELVTRDALLVLRRLIEEQVVCPGEIDLDTGHFIGYIGTPSEVWARVEQQLPVGSHAKYERHLWFDLGAAIESR